MRVVSESFRFYRMMHIRDIYFVGGFGTVQWIDVAEYSSSKPDSIVTYHPHETISALSSKYGRDLVQHFSGKSPEDGASFGLEASVISIDSQGVDVRVKNGWDSAVHRLTFPFKVHTPEEAAKAMRMALGVE
jgi:hypothetical protein